MQKSLAVASVDIPESIPEDIRPLLQCCFEADPSRRLTFSEIQRFPIFMCLLIRNLRIIDSIENKPESERYDFYGTLKQNISLFSQRLLQKKILPLLTKEIFYNFRFGPVVFPLIYLIADRMNKFDFMEYIYKPLAGLFKKMDPPDFAVAVLNGLKIVIDHVEKSGLHDIVYPIIFDGLSSKAAQVQAAAAKHLPYFISMSSESIITYHILPKINSAIVSVSNDPVVIGSLLSSYENCIDQMDNDIFVESVMPALSRLWKKLQSPELAKPFSIIVRKQHATLINNLRHVTPLVCEILTNENVEPSVQDIFLKYVEDQLGSIRKERNIPSNTLNKLDQQRHATSPTSKSQPQTPSFQSLKQQPQANPTQNHLNNQFNSQPNIFSNEQNTFNIQLNENSSQNQNKNQNQNQPNVFQNQQPDIFDNVIFHNQSNQFSSSPNVFQSNNGNLSTEKETNSFVPDYSENKNDDTDFFSLINVVPSQPQPQPFIQNQNQSPQISSNSSTSLFAGMNLM
ncbi:hypothetical protein TRFO_11377 [Tritrichomonas foetus]|uniref:Protein kinase domain-containing protein n=1 Tax=Tritrichomonas foetus TaxID=1144522 RepID=A0A1J4J609_9EUKA|nr:hypothetical protein TRFO_11377 [Tritrichomonas foetus]|eukprot:OHS94105.1 hypothetical protein TRFO_11377 [Tritrichomonas foetus]